MCHDSQPAEYGLVWRILWMVTGTQEVSATHSLSPQPQGLVGFRVDQGLVVISQGLVVIRIKA